MNGDIEVARLDAPGGTLTLIAPAGRRAESAALMADVLSGKNTVISIDPKEIAEALGERRAGWIVVGEAHASAPEAARSALDAFELTGAPPGDPLLMVIIAPSLLSIDSAASAVCAHLDPGTTVYFGGTYGSPIQVALITPVQP